MKKPWRLALCALCFAAAVWLTARYLLPIGLPFLLGWLVSRAAEPAVKRLAGRGFPRWLAAFLCVTGVLALLAGIAWLLGRSVCAGATELAARLPAELSSLSAPLGRLKRRLLVLSARLPEGMAEAVGAWLEGFFAGSSGLAESVSGWLLRFVTGTVSSVPEIALFLLTALLSAYLIATELPRLGAAVKKLLPDARRTQLEALWRRLKAALGGYCKAQVRLMGVTFLIVAAGLLLLRRSYALPLAALIAAVDALPVFGVGTVMVPWGIVTLLRGDTLTGLGLLAVYGAASLTRTVLEPRFLGRQIGLSPLLTLVCLYAGFRLYGILGMILLPVAVILCRQVMELLEKGTSGAS